MGEGSDMNPEFSLREGGAHSHFRKERLGQGRSMMSGAVRERGGGSGGDTELMGISLAELFRTMQTTSSESELNNLRSEKIRRWQEVSERLGDNMNQVRDGIEGVEKKIESGEKPTTGSDVPDVAKRIAETSGLDDNQQLMLEEVMKDEVRAKFLASGRTPDNLKENLIKQDRRQRVTEISGIPVAEGKVSIPGGKGVLIGVKEEEGQPEVVERESKESKTSLDYFRTGKERVSLTALGQGGFIEAYDEMLDNPDDKAKKSEMAERIGRASSLGLNRVISNEIVEEMLEMPKEERGSDTRLTERLEKVSGEAEEAVQEHLREMVKEGKVQPVEAKKLIGYGKLEVTRLAARLKAEDPLYPEPQVTETTKPMEKETAFKWENVRKYVEDEEEKRAGEEKSGVAKSDRFEQMLRRLLGLETVEAGAEVLEPYVEKKLEQFFRGRKEAREAKRGKKEEVPEEKTMSWREADETMKARYKTAASVLPTDEAVKKEIARADTIRREWADKAKKEGVITEEMKNDVRNMMASLVKDYDYTQTERLGRQTANPETVWKQQLMDLRDSRMRNVPDEYKGVVDEWYAGILRNWELARVKVKLDRGHPDVTQERVEELERDVKYLNWGEVKTGSTLAYMKQMAEAAANWDQFEGPLKDQMPKIETMRSEEGKEINGYDNIVGLLTTAMIEGQWTGQGFRSARGAVETWIEANGTDERVSWIKALYATAGWIDVVNRSDDEEKMKAVLRLPYDSETLEAIESNKELLTAKMAVLEATGFNFNAVVEDKEVGGKRRIKAEDIRNGNYPKEFKEYLDKSKKIINRLKKDGSMEEVSFWNLGVNDYKQALVAFTEEVRKSLEVLHLDKKYNEKEVNLLTILAIRQIQNSGFWNMYHTEYSPHPYILPELTVAMHPGDALLAKIDSTDKKLMMEKGQKPGHYRLITGARGMFARRHYETGMYDKNDFKEVQGYSGMTWNRLVLAPEHLNSYLIDPKVFTLEETTLLDRWIQGEVTERREEFHRLGPLKIPGFQRSAAMTIYKEQWRPVTVEGVNKSRQGFLREIGGRLSMIVKDYGLLIGGAGEIRERFFTGPDAQRNTELLKDVARFLFTRGEIFMVPEDGEGKLGKLNRRSFDTQVMAIAMEGWKITKPGKMKHKSVFGGEEWDFFPSIDKEGWWFDVGEEVSQAGIAAERVRIPLTDQGLIDWLKQAGVPYSNDSIGRAKTELIKWLNKDNLAKLLIHINTMRLSDSMIPEWGNMTVKEAFRHGYLRKYPYVGGIDRREYLVGGLGTHEDRPLKKWRVKEVNEKTNGERYLI